MARTDNLSNYLEDVASAIKEKKGDNSPINASEFDNEIENLPSGEDVSEYFINEYPSNMSLGDGAMWKYFTKKLPPIPFSGTNLYYFFSYGFNIIEIDCSLINTGNVTNMTYMFGYCSNLKEIKGLENFNTSNVLYMTSTFVNCNSLVNLNISNFDLGKVVTVNNMFVGCSSLTNLIFGYDLGKGYTQTKNNYSDYILNLNSSNNLTHDSLMSIINNLYDLNLTYDVANGGTLYTQRLQLGTTNKTKLTAEEIAIATNKGWSVS